MSNKSLPSGTSAGMSLTEEAVARTHILALIHLYASLAREESDYSAITELFETDGDIDFPDGRQLAPSQLKELTSSNHKNSSDSILQLLTCNLSLQTKLTARAILLLEPI